MRFIRLKDVSNRRNNICQLRRQDEFTKPRLIKRRGGME